MGIDTSIYSNIKQFDAPSYADAQSKASNLTQMAMQNQKTASDMNADAKQKNLMAVGGAIENIVKLPKDQWESAYNNELGNLVKSGHLSPQDAPPYSEQTVGTMYGQLANNPQWLAIKKSQEELNTLKNSAKIDPELRKADINLKKSEAYKNYATGNKENGGKQLAAEQTDNLAGHDASLKMIGDLRETLSSNKGNFGPVSGFFKEHNPYSTSGQSVSAMFNKAAQVIGKSLEGGKLAEGDIKRYRSMLPNQTDTPEVAEEKINQIERLVQSKRNSDLVTYSKAGLNVGNFSTGGVRDVGVMTAANNGGDISSIGMNSANATPKSKQTPQDAEALFWARKNKSDPRAQKILGLHGES